MPVSDDLSDSVHALYAALPDINHFYTLPFCEKQQMKLYLNCIIAYTPNSVKLNLRHSAARNDAELYQDVRYFKSVHSTQPPVLCGAVFQIMMGSYRSLRECHGHFSPLYQPHDSKMIAVRQILNRLERLSQAFSCFQCTHKISVKKNFEKFAFMRLMMGGIGLFLIKSRRFFAINLLSFWSSALTNDGEMIKSLPI